MINAPTKKIFEDRSDLNDALRSLTFDEATFVSVYIELLGQRTAEEPSNFSVDQLLEIVGKTLKFSNPKKYLRPVWELLQQFVTVGVLVDVTPPQMIGTTPLNLRQFAGAAKPTSIEFGIGASAKALGIPYVAHIYADVAVRIHCFVDGVESIGSGVVIHNDRVVTNRHVIESAQEVRVSWAGFAPVAAASWKGHPTKGIDLAVIAVEGFLAHPYPWMRSPRVAESVVTLAYPDVPQVTSRPLLRFPGAIASEGTVTTYFGDEQIIISSVMGPGASGGGVFSADGFLIGLVVQSLEGKYLAENGGQLSSTFHAAIPSDVLLRELPILDASLKNINTFA